MGLLRAKKASEKFSRLGTFKESPDIFPFFHPVHHPSLLKERGGGFFRSHQIFSPSLTLSTTHLFRRGEGGILQEPPDIFPFFHPVHHPSLLKGREGGILQESPDNFLFFNPVHHPSLLKEGEGGILQEPPDIFPFFHPVHHPSLLKGREG